jgi:nitrite reductase (cytochrome c-552)
MSDTIPSRSRGRQFWPFLLTIILTALGAFGLAALLVNIVERKQEGQSHYFEVVGLSEDVVDPEIWGRNFPRQYDGYRRTVDNERSHHGGSEALPPSKLEADPRLRRIYAGYAFSVDYREKRGHAFMLHDQEQTERVKQFKQPGACLHCHASVLPAFRFAGNGDIMRGFEKVCAMPYAEAHDLVDAKGERLVKHPVACIDCHDPKSMQLRVTRPGFLNGIQALVEGDADLPHLPSVVQWRKDRKSGRVKEGDHYEPNVRATRQEMRSFVCGQCHVEYYFKGTGKLLTYPWQKGLKADQIEEYYSQVGFTDWVHAETQGQLLKAQHPEFEMWNQGIHARSGVACADCHMPYQRVGAVKVSDHQVRSPMLQVNRACQTCHRFDEEEIKARVEIIQNRTRDLAGRAEDALIQMLDAIGEARKNGAAAEGLKPAHDLHRRAQWRVDFVLSENSSGFHSPQEAARLLAEAIDFARRAQIEAIRAAGNKK